MNAPIHRSSKIWAEWQKECRSRLASYLQRAMASLGLPGMSGFVSEFMAFLGLFKEMPWIAAVGTIGIIMTAVLLLARCSASRMEKHIVNLPESEI